MSENKIIIDCYRGMEGLFETRVRRSEDNCGLKFPVEARIPLFKEPYEKCQFKGENSRYTLSKGVGEAAMFEPENIKVYFEVFGRITKELTSKLDDSEVLQDIARLTAEATEVKGCAVWELNPKTRIFEFSAVWGLSQAYLTKGPLAADHSMSACMDGEVVQIENTQNDPRVQYPEDAKSEGIVSMLSVPMMLIDKVIGVLRLYTSESRIFSEDEVAFVRALSNLGVLVLDHARQYSSLKGDHDSLIEDFQTWFDAGMHGPK